MTDKDLVEKILGDRSEKAFRLLYQSKTPMLFRIAVRLTSGDIPLAEDMLQETWVGAIRNLPSFEWRSGLNTWLTSILINVSNAHFRRNKDGISNFANMDTISYPAYGRKMDLENAIDSLPPGYRQVVVLHDIEGYKHKEIATILGITEGTSKSQLANARKSLRKFLTTSVWRTKT